MTKREIVESMMKAGLQKETTEPGNNLVFRCLYDGWCRVKGEKHSFADIVSEANSADKTQRRGVTADTIYGRAFRRIWKWYRETYDKGEGGNKKNGIDRTVTSTRDQHEEFAKFRTPLSYRTFLDHLRNGEPIRGADGYSFLLHTAVAFLLAPEVLDRLLVFYGYMPLHIKNLFHIAIFLVLSNRQEILIERADPFSELERCYMEELEVLNRSDMAASAPFDGETEAFASGSTRVIQQYVLKHELSKARMLSFIERHSSVFQRRHSRLVEEHRYLVTLFSELYMRNDIDVLTDRNDESRYSLYSFLREFCRSGKIKRDTFRNEIYWRVAKHAYHPTREFMTILWLYSFGFLFLPEIQEETWEGHVKDYAKAVPFEPDAEPPFAQYVSAGHLQVLRYLCNEDAKGAPLKGFFDSTSDRTLQFHGSDLIRFLNNKLNDYSWRPLDARSAFDLMIKELEFFDFEIVLGDSGQRVRSIRYNGEYVDPQEIPAVENVPFLLVLFTELLRAIKERRKGSLPLTCYCCELI